MSSWVYQLWSQRREIGRSRSRLGVRCILIIWSRGFKGLKQAIKLEFKLERYDQVHYFCPE